MGAVRATSANDINDSKRLALGRSMKSQLDLRNHIIRAGIRDASGAYKSERHFLDLVVDGESLWAKLGKPDMVSVLCLDYAKDEEH